MSLSWPVCFEGIADFVPRTDILRPSFNFIVKELKHTSFFMVMFPANSECSDEFSSVLPEDLKE